PEGGDGGRGCRSQETDPEAKNQYRRAGWRPRRSGRWRSGPVEQEEQAHFEAARGAAATALVSASLARDSGSTLRSNSPRISRIARKKFVEFVAAPLGLM